MEQQQQQQPFQHHPTNNTNDGVGSHGAPSLTVGAAAAAAAAGDPSSFYAAAATVSLHFLSFSLPFLYTMQSHIGVAAAASCVCVFGLRAFIISLTLSILLLSSSQQPNLTWLASMTDRKRKVEEKEAILNKVLVGGW
jgi:hypothetical protein